MRSEWKRIFGRFPKRTLLMNLLFLLKWLLTALITGLGVGGVGAVFSLLLRQVTRIRTEHPVLILFLPAAGLLIVFLYRVSGVYADHGTDLIISSINQNEQVPLRKAPLIFIATALTHLFGGSAGRESAALQIGGCLGQNLGGLFRFSASDRKIITMCGMSAAFAALFGTPMSAAFLAMEISSVGVLYYSALVPCVLSALTAQAVAAKLGAPGDVFRIQLVPTFTVSHAVVCGILTILCALLSIAFCVILHSTGQWFKRLIANPYLRIAAGGGIIVLLTYLSDTTMFNGAGLDVIEKAFSGDVESHAFVMKIIFTAVTLGSGFKGGEIVPALYIGAAFGGAFSGWFGYHPALCTAIGSVALFCGVTNCPIASLLLAFEMFGYAGMPYFLITIALAYTFSGYYSLYGSQKIVYSKLRNSYVNRKTH